MTKLVSNPLIRTLERGNSLALLLIQRVHHDASVADIDVAVRLLLPRQGVFHPVLVVSLGVCKQLALLLDQGLSEG